jgi:CBS domain-containing protein
MIRLRDIMTREVISVSPELSIREAMGILSSHHISGAPVLAGRDIVGVVTSNDLMEFAAEHPGAPVERTEVIEDYGEPRESDNEVPDNEGEPSATFFTEMWDDAGVDTTVRFASTTGAEWNVLDEHTVAEAMTRSPICSVPASTTLPAAADFMRYHAIHRVLVTEDARLVGIVTATDISRAVAEHKVRDREYVFGRESHFTGQRAGKQPHPETVLGVRLPHDEDEQDSPNGKPPG